MRRDSAGSASSEDDEDDEQGAAGSADVFATSDLSLLVNTKDCKELHDQLRELPLLCTSVLKMDQLVTMFAENDRGGKGVVDTNDVERIVDQIVAGIVVMLPALVRKFYRPPKSSVRSLDLLTVQADGMRKLAASDQLLLHKQAAFARVLTDDGMGGGTASKAAFVDRFPSALQAYLAAFSTSQRNALVW